MNPTAATTFFDPICGMFIDPANAAATSLHRGQTFFFCTTSCKAEFDQAPDEYVSSSREEAAATSCCTTAHSCCTTH